MKIPRRSLSGLAPRLNQLAIPAETVHAAVLITVGHVEIAGGPRHHLRGMIERAGCPQGKGVPVLATRIGMLSARAYLLEQPALERVDHRHVIRLVGHVG